MSDAVFEQAWTFSYTVTKGLDADTVAPDSLVSARIYADYPTAAQIADTGDTAPGDAIQSIESWSEGTAENEKLITFAAIEDPEPTSSNKWESYYVVISYKLTSGGNTINDVEFLTVHRAEGITARFGVVAADIYAIESKLQTVFSDKIAAKIALAEVLVAKDLRGDGYDMQRLLHSSVKELIQYRAAQLACNDLSFESGDVWENKSMAHDREYDTLKKDLPIAYDADDDDDIEPGEETQQIWRNGVYFR